MAEEEVNKSILNSVKKVLGYPPEFTAFDTDITMHINSNLSTLNQLGVGPTEGFFVEDSSSLWEEFSENKLIVNSVKSYIYIKVRLIFDPPATSFVIAALEKEATQLEWRLNVAAESPRTSPEGVL